MELTYQRVHSGYGMAGRTPYGCCVALGFSGSGYVGLMSVVLLDNIVLDWSCQGLPAINDVLAHYSTGGMERAGGILAVRNMARGAWARENQPLSVRFPSRRVGNRASAVLLAGWGNLHEGGHRGSPACCAALMLLLCSVLLLSACQGRQLLRVRVDLARVAQAVALAPALPPSAQLPAQAVAVPPTRRRCRDLSRLRLPNRCVNDAPLRSQVSSSSVPPCMSDCCRRVCRAYLNWRRVGLPNCAPSTTWTPYAPEYDAAWREAFQQHGQARFPLLVALIFTTPDSDARREAQARLDQHDRAWQQREQAIAAAYQARLQRIEQEIAVRVNARKREFVRNAEQEIQAQLAAQPDPAELYLPPPQTPPPPAPPRKASFPPMRVSQPARDLYDALARTTHSRAEQTRQAILRQLAEEWAHTNGYTLTDDPRAPDYTDAFIRYLLAR
jgi:hypothetical protein